MAETRTGANAIAVIGLSVRLPGARNAAEFWQNLAGGIESIRRFTDEELLAEGVAPELLARPTYVKARPVLDDIEAFDAACFGFHPREAEVTDPQHRVFLECALEALEDGGYAADRPDAAIGVFAGCGLSTYLTSNLAHSDAAQRLASSSQIGIGNLQDYLATRVSYKLNLRGPAYAVQSACSTSLLAVHLACQHLLNFECDLALAGGVSIAVPARVGYLYQEGGVLSPDGHCRPFAADAAGTVFGSGAGAVLLKRLDEAVADGDTIYAVVIGSAVNNDGALKAGYTAPSVAGQAAVVTEALAAAGVSPATIGYVETHGTGTILGDPIEVTALTQAFRTAAAGNGFCGIGSVKSNVGHLDAAAGIAGFVKTVLALHHGELPPSLYAGQTNPRIDFAASPFYVNTARQTWPAGDGPRRAGVSAFGVGGTNVHAVLEEAPAPAVSGPARPWQLLVLSGRTEAALESATTNLVDFLDEHPAVPAADVAWTLQTGRRSGEHRRFVVCRDTADAVEKLDAMSPRDVFSAFQKATARSIVFMFPGQGAQHPGMAEEIYRHEPAFREAFDRCADLFAAGLGVDLRPLVFASGPDRPAAAVRLAGTREGEPALFAVEYALARLWMSWGVVPQAMIGHSIGEYVAACLAGVFSLEDAVRLVAARARLVGALPAGAMLAVSRPPDEVRPLLGPALSVAIVNTRASCVVAGDPAAVDDLARRLEATGIPSARLETAHAFHSVMMDEVLADLADAVREVALRPPAIPYVSNVTGRRIADEEATDPAYWARQLRLPVYFADGIRELLKDPSRVLLEVGPGQTLAALTRQNVERGSTSTIVSSLPDRRERQSDLAAVLDGLGRLWLAGVTVDWAGVHAGERRHRVPLPTYPFDRRRYWIDPAPPAETLAAAPDRKVDPDGWFYAPGWKEAPRVSTGSAAAAGWLVFGGADPFTTGFVAHLARLAPHVAHAQPGVAFARTGPSSWTIRPGEADDWARLLTELGGQGPAPDRIVHAAGVAAGDEGMSGERIFDSLLALTQALGGATLDGHVRVGVLTSGLYDITGREMPRPDLALALGPVLVMGQEVPRVSCRNVDIDPGGGADDLPWIWQAIVEGLAGDGDEPVVALRGHHRWVRSHVPAALPRPAGPPRALAVGGVYLITGGFGGLGLTFAHWLASTVQARLVLVGRTAVPPRAQWDEWLATHTDGDDISRRIAAIRAIEAAGGSVLARRADVTSEADMRAVIDAAVERFGGIDGAIHAAGVPGVGLAALKTREAAARVMGPKVEGTRVLERVLRGQRTRFLLLCSSLAALAGGLGQMDYAAANAFLDAWAAARRDGPGPRVLSIDWDAWRDVGMAATAGTARGAEAQRERLRFALTPAEGTDVLARVLDGLHHLDRDVHRLVVSTIDLERRLEQFRARTDAGADRSAAGAARHPRPALRTEYEPPRTDEERLLAGAWQDVLGVDAVGVQDNFFELGGDSLTALRVVERLEADWHRRCSVAEFYAAPTIRLLADRLAAVPVPAADAAARSTADDR